MRFHVLCDSEDLSHRFHSALIGWLAVLVRFRSDTMGRPKWLLIVANIVLVIFGVNFLLYVGGVATFYE